MLCLLAWVLPLPLAQAAADGPLAAYRAVSAVPVNVSDNGQAVGATTSLALDRRGRLWIGGYSRLTRLDGVQVRHYRGGQAPLEQGYIRALLALDNGDMLVGGNREGVLLWQLDSGRLLRLQSDDGRVLTRINGLAADAAGGAWVAAEQGLFHWPGGDSRRLQPVAGLHGLPQLTPRVFAVLQGRDGSLWVARHNGLYRRAAGDAAFVAVATGQPQLDRRLADETIWSLAEDGRGRIWAGLVRSGAVVIDGAQAFAPAGLDGEQGVHRGRTIRSLLWAAGRMWLGTDGQGLISCVAACTQASPVAVSLNAFEGQRNFHVRGLIQSDDGRIWAASDRGVFHFDPDPRGVYELDVTPPGVDPRQRFNITRSLLLDQDQQLWLGREAGELLRWDLASGQRRLFTLPGPLAEGSVNAMAVDERGRLWLAGSGVAWMDRHTGQVRPAGELSARASGPVNAMVVAGQRAWLGYHDGLLEVDLQGHVRRQMVSDGHGLRTTHVTVLATQGPWLWAGTSEGLHRIDLARWQAQAVELSAADDPLAVSRARLIHGLAVDGPHLWVATGAGIFHLDGHSGAVRPIAGTAALEINSLQLDQQHQLWFSTTPAGLGVVRTDGRVWLYGARDGVHDSRGFRRSAVQRLDSGELLFGSGIGVSVVDGRRLQGPPQPAPQRVPVITAVQVDGQRWPEGRLPAPGQSLHLQPHQQRLLVEFSALQLMDAQRYRHAFKLEGHDRDWTVLEAGVAPMALYGRLPAGDYTLLLRVASEEQPGQQWVSRYPLQVLPLWYQNRWVHVLLVASLVLLVSLLLWAREQIARRRQRRLEQLVAQRTEELQRANVQLAALAGEDALTGLYNRRRLLQRINELIEEGQRHRGTHSLLLLDLDHFKDVNDCHGHAAGDAVLRAVARLLHGALRAQDMAARYGGEELLLLLPNTAADDAAEVAERLRQGIAALQLPCPQGVLSITASFGVAQLRPGQTAEQWIERADLALYRAKREGRNRVCVERLPD
ncbi:MAG: diguanylate cyclase [Stenotrophomonas sp.]